MDVNDGAKGGGGTRPLVEGWNASRAEFLPSIKLNIVSYLHWYTIVFTCIGKQNYQNCENLHELVYGNYIQF